MQVFGIVKVLLVLAVTCTGYPETYTERSEAVRDKTSKVSTDEGTPENLRMQKDGNERLTRRGTCAEYGIDVVDPQDTDVVFYATDPKTNGTRAMKRNFKHVSIYAHNHYRKKHQQTNPVGWDSKLACEAQKWAEDTLAENVVDHENNVEAGENIFQMANSFGAEVGPEYAVRSWYHEIEDYSWSHGSVTTLSNVGHFTQVIWRDSIKIGCGRAIKVDDYYDQFKMVVIVCRYTPAQGVGSFSNNVQHLKPELTVDEVLKESLAFLIPNFSDDECFDYSDAGCTRNAKYCYMGYSVEYVCRLTCDSTCPSNKIDN